MKFGVELLRHGALCGCHKHCYALAMKITAWLSKPAGTAVPRTTSIVCASLAALLFFASALLQLRASHSRWVTFAGTLGPTDFSIESHEYDYYLPGEGYLPIPDTGVPMGTGLLLQSAGMVLLLLCLLSSSSPGGRISRNIQLTLGLLASASCALIGYDALRTELDGEPPGLTTSVVSQVIILLGFVALGALCAMCLRWFPAVGIACFCLLGTTVLGFLVIYLFVAPMFTGYVSHDTTPGTETIMALTTAVAGLFMLISVIALLCQGMGRSRAELTKTI